VARALMRAASAIVPTPGLSRLATKHKLFGMFPDKKLVHTSVNAARRSACATMIPIFYGSRAEKDELDSPPCLEFYFPAAPVGTSDPSILSKAPWLASIVLAGPVNLKKIDPCGPSTMAPSIRYPGIDGPDGAVGPPIPV
jgi:hypothetical protein